MSKPSICDLRLVIAALLLFSCAALAGGPLDPLPLPGGISGIDQISVAIFNASANAINVEAYPGPSGTHTPSDADQVFTSIFNSANNSIFVNLFTSVAPASGNCLVWNGTAWEPGSCATGSGAGTVTSVGLSLPSIFTVSGSPITTSGTLTGALAAQSANLVFAGPSSGAAAAPTFRLLVPADIPALSYQAPLSTYSAPTNEFLTSFTSPNTFTAAQPSFSNLSGTVAASQLPDPTATTLGGIESAAAVAHEWINSISTSGVPALSQPAFSDISGTAAASQIPNPAGDVTGTYAATTVTGLHFGTNGYSLSASALISGQCVGYNGTNIGGVTCGSGGSGLPANWTQNTTTGEVTGQPASSQDAQTLALMPNTASPSADIFQIYNVKGSTLETNCSTGSGNCVFSIGANGNMWFAGNSATYGTADQSTASFLHLFGGGGSPSAQGYLELSSAPLASPAAPTLTAASGGSLAASTIYDVELTFTNAAGETVPGSSTASASTPSTCPTSGNCEFTVTAPTSAYNATGYNVYAKTSGGSNYYLQNGGTPVAIGSNYTFSAFTSTSSGAPTANTTGGAINDYLQMAAEGNVLCVDSAIPGADCAAGTIMPTISATAPTTGHCVEWASGTSLEDAGAACGSGGSSAWSALTNPTGNLSLTMGSDTTTFDSSLTSAAFTWQQSTAATSSANYDSPALVIGGTVWSGSASVNDQWTIQESVASGTEGASTLTFSQAGSTGAAYLDLDGSVWVNLPSGQNHSGVTVSAPSGYTGDPFVFDLNSITYFSVSPSGNIMTQGNLNFSSNGSHLQQDAASSDIAGTIAISAASSASHTFNAAYAVAPVCTLTPTSNPGSLTWWVTTSTSAVTANLSASGTITFNYICVGNPD